MFSKDKKNTDNRIKSLRDENRRLRAENLALRKESDNVIIMRNHYFFTFKRRILSEASDRTTFIF